MARFEARASAGNGRTVVTLEGECDLTASDALTSVLTEAVEGAEVVVVDLAGLRFLDSTGVHGLVAGHHAAAERGVRLYLVNAAGVVAQVLNLTGVADLLRPPADDADPLPA